MESQLYRSILEKGEARGETRGEARGETRTLVEMLIRALTHRLGAPDLALRERIRAETDRELLHAWCDEAIYTVDAEGARRLAEKIRTAPRSGGE